MLDKLTPDVKSYRFSKWSDQVNTFNDDVDTRSRPVLVDTGGHSKRQYSRHTYAEGIDLTNPRRVVEGCEFDTKSDPTEIRGLTAMTDSTFYKDRWVNIDPDRLARYQQMFQWSPASKVFYEAAAIGEGHVVGELGSGPGHTAVEIARMVGPTGHVHTLDINKEFVAQTESNARAAGFENRITAHLYDGKSAFALPDAQLDRMTVRNTLIYVDDAQQTLREFKRVLKPGGIAHAIEGDWPMMIVEPLPSADWAIVVNAADHACRTPKIGRKLYGLFLQAGFTDVSVQLITRPDTDGRLLGMVKNMADYARTSGKVNDAIIEKVVASVDEAVAQKTYLALAPQFVVTARA